VEYAPIEQLLTPPTTLENAPTAKFKHPAKIPELLEVTQFDEPPPIAENVDAA
jgi:hypothetical protein